MTGLDDPEFRNAVARERRRRADAAAERARDEASARQAEARQRAADMESRSRADRLLGIGRDLARLAKLRGVAPDVTVSEPVPVSGIRKWWSGGSHRPGPPVRAWRIASFGYSYESGIAFRDAVWAYGLATDGYVIEYDGRSLRRQCRSPDDLLVSIRGVHPDALANSSYYDHGTGKMVSRFFSGSDTESKVLNELEAKLAGFAVGHGLTA